MSERTRISISPEHIEVEIESEYHHPEVVEMRVVNLIKDLMPKDTKTKDSYRDV